MSAMIMAFLFTRCEGPTESEFAVPKGPWLHLPTSYRTRLTCVGCVLHTAHSAQPCAVPHRAALCYAGAGT